MYRRILVPVDGSSTSMRGVEHALALAKNQRARLRLLNVIDEEVIVPGMDPYAPLDMTPLIDGVKTEGQKGLKKAVALAARRKIRTDVAMLRSRGLFVSEVILSDARKWRADLIVMGTARTPRFQPFAHGQRRRACAAGCARAHIARARR